MGPKNIDHMKKIVVSMKCLPGARHCSKMLCMHCLRAKKKKKQFNIEDPVVFPQTTNRLARACYEISCKDSSAPESVGHSTGIPNKGELHFQGDVVFPAHSHRGFTSQVCSDDVDWVFVLRCEHHNAPRSQVNKELWSFWHLKVYYYVV